ncbi:peptide chain release factor N(5)-glutamine methyltransferase [Aedoeadaptatus urinae]|uniref:peptide chain release factor N(5)-glutamine methyltransferase n=1 Tax=Aedoeadaptatus urinae TaxID=1871017 RepID=UPI00097DF1D0|nr:peptide chain release factor N(5)-glutamine methyltransferase [Peptoniphilus urinae]
MEVKEAFDEACAALKGDRRRAYLVFDALFQLDQKAVLLYPEKNLNQSEVSGLRRVIGDMASGKPMAYALKQEYFYGEKFYVDERVLIPRYDTERSVDCMKSLAPKAKRILEIGTGSGCVAITLARLYPEAEVHGVDISADALDVAALNAKNHGVKNVLFTESDLFSKVRETYDIIYSNPPYITADEMNNLDKSVVDYEPEQALYGGVDGLDFYRKITAEAPNFLNDGGYLVFEIGANQREDVEKLLREHHFSAVGCEKDFSGLDRVVYGRIEYV